MTDENELETTEVYEQPEKKKDYGSFMAIYDHEGSKRYYEVVTSLRDQFAMAALTGILVNPNTRCPEHIKNHFAYYSEAAYQYADEMLLARKTPVKSGDKE